MRYVELTVIILVCLLGWFVGSYAGSWFAAYQWEQDRYIIEGE